MALNIKIEIDAAGEAFEDDAEAEVRRVIAEAADKIPLLLGVNFWDAALRDVNGNRVGFIKIERAS